MPDLPTLSYSKFIKKIRKAGFIFKRQAAGSHEIWFNPKTKKTVTVAHHQGKDFKKGTLSAMVKDTGLSRGEFIKL